MADTSDFVKEDINDLVSSADLGNSINSIPDDVVAN